MTLLGGQKAGLEVRSVSGSFYIPTPRNAKFRVALIHHFAEKCGHVIVAFQICIDFFNVVRVQAANF